jgi:hypothetical protein
MPIASALPCKQSSSVSAGRVVRIDLCTGGEEKKQDEQQKACHAAHKDFNPLLYNALSECGSCFACLKQISST